MPWPARVPAAALSRSGSRFQQRLLLLLGERAGCEAKEQVTVGLKPLAEASQIAVQDGQDVVTRVRQLLQGSRAEVDPQLLRHIVAEPGDQTPIG